MTTRAELQKLRYPLGFPKPEGEISPEQIEGWIGEIEALPAQIRAAVAGLNAEQLDTQYREDGWTVRQVVHHVADSHLNSIIRFKWTLTEDRPKIKAYDEKGWAELEDGRSGDIELSLALLDSLHARWAVMLHALTPEQFKRCFIHPDLDRAPTGSPIGEVPLDFSTWMYAWHGRHHVAHITGLRDRMGW